jgi:hypothetical protein
MPVYAITAAGRKALENAKLKLYELHHELHEQHLRKISSLK